MKQIDNLEVLDNLIFGRVTPHIYAFQTGTVPNYLKIGDTYRPVSVRLKEWERKFPDLTKEYEQKATVTEDVYFRDHAVHYYLEVALGKERLLPEQLPEGAAYYSREFFKEVLPIQIEDAIRDIRKQYTAENPTYSYYDAHQRLAVTLHYERGPVWQLRPNQQEAVDNFVTAVNNGRTNLLMYAVMRFGKSFTSLACAKAMNAKTVLIVSAKADVREEWKKNVERPGNFAGYQFLSSEDLLANDKAISDIHAQEETAVIFLTLQDLQGSEMKTKHAEVFKNEMDLLIVDETHFGARAASYGEILRTAQRLEEKNLKDDLKLMGKQEDEQVDLEDASKQLKELKAKVRLHLSGTPYRILMGSEFAPEDIISFVQFTDIANEQKAWDEQHLDNDDVEEWDNPYFGFPQMIRFAFHPSRRAIEKMKELEKSGVSLAFSALLKPKSIKKDAKTKLHQQFEHEAEILDLLRIIDGSASDSKLLGFLDYEKIKQGQMCRHMVMVLPYCASCDAMEKLIQDHKTEFKNLGEYEVLNISGVDASRTFRTPTDIKARIAKLEAEGKKTLTLTVNRMLTGSTVEQWDTMLYLKDTASPQEYDQAIFRLQNQYVRELSDGEKTIKECLKPQTLLVDFDPHRLFTMQEQKSLIYNANTEKNGNARLQERIADELRISPVITMNHNKLEQVQATDILQAVSQYNNSRSITDEVVDLPIDLSILSDEDLRRVIEAQNPFGSKGGLTLEAHESDTEGTDLDTPDEDDTDQESGAKPAPASDSQPTLPDNEKEIKDLENKIRTYYQRILFFAFLCPEPVQSLDDILATLEQGKNARLAHNLGIQTQEATTLRNALNAFKLSALDYKIQNISTLATDENLEPLERATTSLAKFSRMSVSEIITPMNVADEMVALLPEEQLRTSIESGEKLLDIASKAGEYTVALAKRLHSLGFTTEQFKDSIYAIPTSSVAYEFTRRFYEILGLNTECIASQFNSYDLLEIKKENEEVDYEHIKEILRQKKTFAEITLGDNPQGGETVNFGAVVGNPPYQVADNMSGKGSAKPIYNHFVMAASSLSPKSMTLITPSVWFTGGKGLDTFRNWMLRNNNLAYLRHYITPQDVFKEVNLRGGVSYFLLDALHSAASSGVQVSSVKNKEVISDGIRPVTIPGIESFIPDNTAISMIERLLERESITLDESSPQMLISHISSRNPYGFTTKFVESADFHEHTIDGYIKMYASRGRVGYIDPELLAKNKDWADRWKVLTPFANNVGTNLPDDNINFLISEPGSISTETYLVIGANLNANEIECNRLGKYLQTKFVRFLISLAKANQNGTRKTYRLVPFVNPCSSELDWDSNLDKQLYDKFDLTAEEIDLIENQIKPMEE